jgi:hypothetical protein
MRKLRCLLIASIPAGKIVGEPLFGLSTSFKMDMSDRCIFVGINDRMATLAAFVVVDPHSRLSGHRRNAPVEVVKIIHRHHPSNYFPRRIKWCLGMLQFYASTSRPDNAF